MPPWYRDSNGVLWKYGGDGLYYPSGDLPSPLSLDEVRALYGPLTAA